MGGIPTRRSENGARAFVEFCLRRRAPRIADNIDYVILSMKCAAQQRNASTLNVHRQCRVAASLPELEWTLCNLGRGDALFDGGESYVLLDYVLSEPDANRITPRGPTHCEACGYIHRYASTTSCSRCSGRLGSR